MNLNLDAAAGFFSITSLASDAHTNNSTWVAFDIRGFITCKSDYIKYHFRQNKNI